VQGPLRNHANESNYRFGLGDGAARILRLLTAHDCAATWTVCGQSLEQTPALAAAIVARGDEAASHGYRWQFQYKMDEDKERAFIAKATESITASVGKRPLGWLSRYMPSDNTRRLLSEAGYIYHMDDFSAETPFWDATHATPIVIVPYQLDTNDMKLWSDPGYTARDWADYVIDSFDTLHEEGAGMLSIGIHLRIMGRPGRACAFARVLRHIKSRHDVWCARRIDIARHFMRHQVL
jgi:allantoinase